jgi:hypothetical protein
MGGKADAFLKVSIAVSILVASVSVGYYYLAYLPNRDLQADNLRRQEQIRAELAKKSDEARAAAALQLQQRIEAQRQSETQAQYQACVAGAEENYSRSWAAACKRANEQSIKARASCDTSIVGKSLCDSSNPIRDPSPNCTLYGNTGGSLNATLEKSRNRCLEESKLGLR